MNSPPQVEDMGAIVPRTLWPDILRETAIEVFSIMVGISVTAPDDRDVPVKAQVAGMVGIAGPLVATFSLRCSTGAATLIASRMLGVSVDEAGAQNCDAVGEICNIVAGSFKAKIGLGDVCVLSVPTVLAGADYQILAGKDEVLMELPLLHEYEPIWIALHIRV
jgi:chemotaxis protein CheX